MKRLTQITDYCAVFCRMEDRKECAYWTGCVGMKCGDARIYDRLAAYENTGMEPEQVSELKGFIQGGIHKVDDGWAHVQELLDAEKAGRLVVLPFAPGTTLVDRSELERPALMKNFRLAVAYGHNGIVFHQPFSIFLENVRRGYFTQVSEEAERVLAGGADHA